MCSIMFFFSFFDNVPSPEHPYTLCFFFPFQIVFGESCCKNNAQLLSKPKDLVEDDVDTRGADTAIASASAFFSQPKCPWLFSLLCRRYRSTQATECDRVLCSHTCYWASMQTLASFLAHGLCRALQTKRKPAKLNQINDHDCSSW